LKPSTESSPKCGKTAELGLCSEMGALGNKKHDCPRI
jgi:hypothetical protein